MHSVEKRRQGLHGADEVTMKTADTLTADVSTCSTSVQIVNFVNYVFHLYIQKHQCFMMRVFTD